MCLWLRSVVRVVGGLGKGLGVWGVAIYVCDESLDYLC